jgi:hypothetical protein
MRGFGEMKTKKVSCPLNKTRIESHKVNIFNQTSIAKQEKRKIKRKRKGKRRAPNSHETW